MIGACSRAPSVLEPSAELFKCREFPTCGFITVSMVLWDLAPRLHELEGGDLQLRYITQSTAGAQPITQQVALKMHASIQKYVHTYIHTYIHTHIHTCVHAYICIVCIYALGSRATTTPPPPPQWYPPQLPHDGPHPRHSPKPVLLRGPAPAAGWGKAESVRQ